VPDVEEDLMRKRSKYRPKPVMANAVAYAIESATKIEPAQVDKLIRCGTEALAALKAQVGDVPHAWRALADVFNVCEALSDIGILSDDYRRALLAEAQAALGAIMERHNTINSWTLRGSEMGALEGGLWVQRSQLQYASLSEYERARREVVNRVRAALAGNAPRGVRVYAP
jgi:hypothetical protein